MSGSSWWPARTGPVRGARCLRAFRASGRQGVNYARGTWHHPLIVLAPDQRSSI
jgi:ureidoglycolate lyase